MGEWQQVKGSGQIVVISTEDIAHLGCWKSGMSRGAEVHTGTL